MSNQQKADRSLISLPIERVWSTAGASAAYITILIGYLLTILTTPPHLTLLNFITFTVLQLIYCAILWWFIKNDLTKHLRIIATLMLTLLTVVTGLLSFSGLQWDWLLYLVTIAVYFTALSLRMAIISGVLLYLLLVVNLGYLNNWNWSHIYYNLLSLFPAFFLSLSFL